MAFPITPVAGLSLDGIETGDFAVGTEVTDNQGRRRLLVNTNGSTVPCLCLHINSAFLANAMTPALAITAGQIGFMPASASASATQKVWAIMSGPVRVRVAASCQPNIPLYTTDTAGVLDDASVSLSQFQVMGIEVDTGYSNSAAGASNLPATAGNLLIRHPVQAA